MGLEGAKGTVLDSLWFSEPERRPRWAVEIWNPRQTTVQDVVRGVWKGPRLDISDWVQSVKVSNNQVFENDDNSISSRAELVINVEENIDIGGLRRIDMDQRLFRNGTPVRIYQGDRRVRREDWLPVFTGVVRGHPGANTAARGVQRRIRVACFGRAQSFQRQIIVGLNWPYGTDLGDMAVDIAMLEMKLDRDEIRFGLFDFATEQKANAVVQVPKMQGLFSIMHTVGRKPYFDAFGRLVSHDTSFTKPPMYVYDRNPTIKSITRVQQLKSGKNSVQVIGLNSTLTKVVQPVRQLAEVNLTTGYFDSSVREVIFYSEDRKRRAQNTFVSNVHGNFGESESWEEIDEFSGKLTISTGYAPWVVGAIIGAWAVTALLIYIIDIILDSTGSNEYLAVAKFILNILLAAEMAALLVAMTRFGRYRVFIYGEPFEYVFEENRAINVLKGVPTADVDELEVRLPFLHTIDLSDTRSGELLERELVKGAPYRIEMLSNPIIEVDDLIVIRDERRLPDSKYWTFYITSIDRGFDRSRPDDMMTLSTWHVRSSDTV